MSSIIQNIRDKYARIAVIAIALSLLGFILMDALNNRTGGFFNRRSSTMGRVNGKKIDATAFEEKVRMQEEMMRANGQSMNTMQNAGFRENLWNDEVEKTIMSEEFDNLGIAIGSREINDIILNNPTENLYQQVAGQGGNYDGAAVQQTIANLRKSKNAMDVYRANELAGQIEYDRKMEKYKDIMISTISYPKWFFEKQNADRASMAKVSYVAVPYDVIKDSLVNVTDKEIQDYINKHKDLYKQSESRSIRYVSFSAAPTAADTAANRDALTALKSEFAADSNAAAYLSSKGSMIPFSDLYVGKSQMQIPAKDSVQLLSKGQVYGPYLDGANFTLAKMLDIKTLPDSVFCKHILLRTAGEGGLPDSIAEKRLDSAIAAINAGASFDTVMQRVSMDQAANSQEGGLMKFTSQQIQNKAGFDQDFAKFILYDGKAGERRKVKTQFGWHYIYIVNQVGVEPHYQVAYFSKAIDPSQETEDGAQAKAQSFTSSVSNAKSFEENAKKNNYNILNAENIGPNDYVIQTLNQGSDYCKSFIKDIYAAKVGSIVSTQDPIGQTYVVALVSEAFEEGTMSAAQGRRSGLAQLLVKKKKAEQIAQKIGKVSTLEAAAAIYSLQVQNADSVRLDGSKPIGMGGYEPKLLGAAFNPDNKGKVVPEALEGQSGVYVLRVDDVTATPVLDNTDPETQAKQAEAGTRQSMLRPQQQFNFPGMGSQSYNPATVLKAAATIKDNRARLYQ